MKYFEILTESDEILYEGWSEEPFKKVHELKRKTFADVVDKDFRNSPLRKYLKKIINNGGVMKIQINENRQ